jgi:hypothetical protein
MDTTRIKRLLRNPSKIPYAVYRRLLLMTGYERVLIRIQPYRHKRALKKVQEKVKRGEKITVAFFVIYRSMWKCDELFKKMHSSKLFDPVIIVCPCIVYGQDVMVEEMNNAYNYFKEKDYNVIKTYNNRTNKWIDIKKTVNPNIVFFESPYNTTKKEYYITNYLDVLTCYVPYGIMSANIQQSQFNQTFHNLCWKIFCETRIHVELHRKYAVNKGCNAVFTGYPLLDKLFKINTQNNPWKKQTVSKKKIIWAPHYTIENNEKQLAYSCFLLLYDFMLEVAERYRDKIQIAFKPHPALKGKLYKHPNWGKSLTKEYYRKWENLSNGQLEEGEYIDLFLTSDAMILDSISFISEYIVTQKPSLFTIRDHSIYSKFNEFGILNFNMLYKTSQLKVDTINYIENIINGIDTMKNDRIDFIDKYLTPPNNKTACENIYENLKDDLITIT